jgi:hypothetical protein
MPAPPPAGSPPPPAPPPPAPLVVGAAESIDSGGSGNPVNVRVARSANGDGFAVWQADDGTRRNLWANRFRSTSSMWDGPITIEASNADIDDFDVTVDAKGNAVVAWHEAPADPRVGRGVVMSARFDTGLFRWTTPVPLNTDSNQPRVASDATGAVLAVYTDQSNVIRGRFFDPVSGTWQPEALIEQNNTGTGFSFGPLPLLDGGGNALVAYHNERSGPVGILASNYFSRSSGGWGQLPANGLDILGVVPGSLTAGGQGNPQLVTTTDGNFLLAWSQAESELDPEGPRRIVISRFTTAVRTWSAAQTLIPGSAEKNVQLQRIGSDSGGNVHVLWTENDGTRTALKAVRLDSTGAVCSLVDVIDRAIGGSAARVDLGVNPRGDAIAIWQQFEGGRPDDGSRSNIAINGFDRTANAWASAVFAETQPGNAISPRASANGGRALLAWIQSEGGANRVKALLQTLASDFMYTPISFPGASGTGLSDINNNGVIVGGATTTQGVIPFVYANGTFTPFDPALGSFTGISDAGVIVGQKPFVSGQTTAFILENGVTTLFEAQGAQAGTTRLAGISPDGRYLVGVYNITASGIGRTFAFDRRTGTQTNINEAAYELVFQSAGGVTNSGLVVAYESELFTSDELFVRSYLHDLNTGTRTDIDADNRAPGYSPGDINASGQIVGSYNPTVSVSEQSTLGFVGSAFSPPSTFTLLDVPGSTPGSTLGTGINDSGTFVGTYATPSGTVGYIARRR